MLYVTTRSQKETYTAFTTLTQERGRDGGLFVPLCFPQFTQADIKNIGTQSFAQTVAQVLNCFFPSKLDALDVSFCLGREPVKLVSMSHRIFLGEAWRNSQWHFSGMVQALVARILGIDKRDALATNWARICVRIAFLFGFYGEFVKQNQNSPCTVPDIAISAMDTDVLPAVWYARSMGLPVGTIVCGNFSEELWDLLQKGELHVTHDMPDLERVFCSLTGCEDLRNNFTTPGRANSCRIGTMQLQKLKDGIFAAVISKQRWENVLKNVYRTNGYILGGDCALAYGALQDYRAASVENRPALILSEYAPIHDAQEISQTLGLSVASLKDRLR